MLLCELNHHPRDDDITFYEDTHEYEIRGDRNYMSVTTFVKQWFAKFDADKIIAKMMRSPKWEQSKYYGMTPEEIKKTWSDKGSKAAELGTQMHKSFEDHYNGIPIPEEELLHPEFDMFRVYEEEIVHPENLKPYRTEWCVWDREVRIAGSIDMIYTDHQGNFYIYDWKRTVELKEDNMFQKGLPPLEHVPDTNFFVYSLQLSTYKYLLEKNYGKTIKGMFLVCIHPENEKYMRKEVADMSAEVKMLMEERARQCVLKEEEKR
jgi:hypothetical protein